MARRTRLILAITAVTATAAMALSAFSLKDRALEWWYLRRLGSEDAAARRKALEGLARVGSSVALPRHLRTRMGPEEQKTASALLKEAIERRGSGGVRDLLE